MSVANKVKKNAVKYFLIIILSFFIFNILNAQTPNDIFRMIKSAGDTSDYPKANTIKIFDSTKVDVMESGMNVVNAHYLTKILTVKGANNLRTIQYRYEPLSAFIEFRKATIYKKSGKIIDIDTKNAYDYPAPAGTILWGSRELMIAIGRLEVGDAVEIKYYKKGFTYALLDENDDKFIPPMKGHFYEIKPFWSSVPILEKYYEVRIPKSKYLQYKVYNGDLTFSKKETKDKDIYIWSKKNIEAFKKEKHMVSQYNVAPKVVMSTAKDWKAKSVWFYNVNHDYGSFDVTPEIKKMSFKIIKDSETDLEKISALTHWVAENIRYFGLSMGEGEGYTLHKGSMTFRDRCGVCKDKAGMLITMLRAVGFESYAAMTMAGAKIDSIPADYFNHSVVVVKYDGEYKLLDPTWVPGVRELWSSAEQQQNYLIGAPEGIDLRMTPISPPEEHYYKVNGNSKLESDGTLTGNFIIESEKQSDARFRRILRGKQKNNWESVFEELMYDISPYAEITKLKYQNPYDISKPMKIEVEYTIPNYAFITENEIHFTPIVATYLFWNRTLNYHLFMDLSEDEKKYGFKYSCSRLVNFHETITLPKSFAPKVIPEYDTIDSTATKFNANYETKKDTLFFDMNLVFEKRVYESDEWTAFKNSVEKVKELAKDKIVLEKTGELK
ncbi:MAG: DUF3857 and transglutaminase domain-containing protein [Candidatus Marinimicrobia bacterium]|nr:DUF3857 and transglutaminase domain-containing protein [Candidatus Neomarinimicrobiota bacterium]